MLFAAEMASCRHQRIMASLTAVTLLIFFMTQTVQAEKYCGDAYKDAVALACSQKSKRSASLFPELKPQGGCMCLHINMYIFCIKL